MNVIIKHVLEDYNLSGFVISERAGKPVGYTGMYVTTDGSLLAHDVLEHWDSATIQHNMNELVALGTMLHAREDAFYSRRGDNGFPYDVAEQLYYYYNPHYMKVPTSSNSYVKAYLDDHWEDVCNVYESEFDEPLPNKRHSKMLAYRFLSRGYNHSAGLQKRGQHLGLTYSVLKDWFDEIMGDLEEAASSSGLNEFKLNVNSKKNIAMSEMRKAHLIK